MTLVPERAPRWSSGKSACRLCLPIFLSMAKGPREYVSVRGSFTYLFKGADLRRSGTADQSN